MNTNFSNLFSLSKTLRFELIPQGKTLEFIEKNGLLTQDFNRSEAYKKAKKLIDDYHKHFIEEVLNKLSINNLEAYETLYNIPKRTENEKKQF